MNKLDQDEVANIHWVQTGEDAQGEIMTTTNHELQEDAYASCSLLEPGEVQEMVYRELERLSRKQGRILGDGNLV